LSTEQLLDGLAGKIAKGSEVVNAMPIPGAGQREKINQAFGVITNLVKDSGIEDVSGLGASSVMHEPGLYHSKVLLHHYPGKGNGVLWTTFGKKPHALTGLDLLPASTVVACFGDADAASIWAALQKECKAGPPEAQQMLSKVPEAFEQAAGVKWDQVLASLGGEFGFAVLFDDSHKITLPTPGQPIEFPEPSLLLVAKVNDDTIFNRLDELMKKSGQQVTPVDKPNLKMRTLVLPLPLPIQVRPTIAQSEGYLLIANSENVIEQALAVRGGKGKGLKTTAEFQRLSKDVPNQGNNFTFVSQRFGETLLQVQQQAMAARNSGNSGAQWIQSMLGTNAAGCGFYVSGNTDQGWLAIGNGNRHPAKVLLTAGVVPAAISAVAIPNFIKARQAAQKRAQPDNSQ
jgi:hypothetical protein